MNPNQMHGKVPGNTVPNSASGMPNMGRHMGTMGHIGQQPPPQQMSQLMPQQITSQLAQSMLQTYEQATPQTMERSLPQQIGTSLLRQLGQSTLQAPGPTPQQVVEQRLERQRSPQHIGQQSPPQLDQTLNRTFVHNVGQSEPQQIGQPIVQRFAQPLLHQMAYPSHHMSESIPPQINQSISSQMCQTMPLQVIRSMEPLAAQSPSPQISQGILGQMGQPSLSQMGQLTPSIKMQVTQPMSKMKNRSAPSQSNQPPCKKVCHSIESQMSERILSKVGQFNGLQGCSPFSQQVVQQMQQPLPGSSTSTIYAMPLQPASQDKTDNISKVKNLLPSLKDTIQAAINDAAQTLHQNNFTYINSPLSDKDENQRSNRNTGDIFEFFDQIEFRLRPAALSITQAQSGSRYQPLPTSSESNTTYNRRAAASSITQEQSGSLYLPPPTTSESNTTYNPDSSMSNSHYMVTVRLQISHAKDIQDTLGAGAKNPAHSE